MTFRLFLGLMVILMTAMLAFAQDAEPARPQVVILKLDDVGHWVSPRWQKVTDFLAERQIKASYGVITGALEKVQPQTVTWVKDLHDRGAIEFWLHGYTVRGPKDKGEFEQGTAEEQAALLAKGVALGKEKLGIDFVAFGEHWSGRTAETEKAVEMTPQIKVWLYGPKASSHYTRLSLPRVVGLENPTFVPDFAKFKAAYDKSGASEPVLVLQGHPDAWGDQARWDGFVQIIDYLQGKNVVFMTPSEYLATREAK
jgi:peptidoglycan/xylan/chitin deacetylase (PgdA/CDA1 family)